jgi:hypothetical protein
VPLELLIPVAFAAGALFKTDRRIQFRGTRVLVAVAAVTVLALPLLVLAGTTYSVSGQSWISDTTKESLLWDRVAPAWGNPADGPSVDEPGTGNSWMFFGVIERTFQVRATVNLATLTDVRFELWRAIPFPGAPDWTYDYVPDPAYETPFATQAAALTGDTFAMKFDLSHVKATRWLIFMVGTGPDGHRYRLNWPESVTTSFSGTVWDWLTTWN